MMTDRMKLEKMKEEVMLEESSYERMKKENVLEKLIISADNKTEQLMSLIIIPMYEHDGDFLKKTLSELGYTPSYEEEYNAFWERMCYKVTL